MTSRLSRPSLTGLQLAPASGEKRTPPPKTPANADWSTKKVRETEMSRTSRPALACVHTLSPDGADGAKIVAAPAAACAKLPARPASTTSVASNRGRIRGHLFTDASLTRSGDPQRLRGYSGLQSGSVGRPGGIGLQCLQYTSKSLRLAILGCCALTLIAPPCYTRRTLGQAQNHRPQGTRRRHVWRDDEGRSLLHERRCPPGRSAAAAIGPGELLVQGCRLRRLRQRRHGLVHAEEGAGRPGPRAGRTLSSPSAPA